MLSLNPTSKIFHRLHDLENTLDEKRRILLEEYFAKKKKAGQAAEESVTCAKKRKPNLEEGRFAFTLEYSIQVTQLGDSGSEHSVISPHTWDRLKEKVPLDKCKQFHKSMQLSTAICGPS